MAWIFDRSALEERLLALSMPERIAFGAACCERLFRAYERFEQLYKWGNSQSLRDALDASWLIADGMTQNDESLDQILGGVAASIPHSDDFGSVEGALAQDAALACCDVLDIALGRVSDFGQPAERVIEALDLLVQEQEQMDAQERGLEDKIRDHKLMQQELGRQERDLRLLAARRTAIDHGSDLRRIVRDEDATVLA